MRGELVAIDVETTGLDPAQDAIIEIGAVRTRDGVIVAEFATLVNPGIPIPANVTHLTGIKIEDVIGAPDIREVLPGFRDFVGSAPIIGHNVAFDIAFFRLHAILQDNVHIDTYDLASVLLPRAPRYNLNSLTGQLGIELAHAHRALDDARASALLYWVLWNKALALPDVTLSEISMAARGMNWDSAVVFDAALATKPPAERVAQQPELTALDIFGAFSGPELPRPPKPENQPLNEADIAQLMGPEGPLARSIPYYEYRPSQAAMAGAIARAFGERRHLMAEAGAGIGKSIAYLIPSILWSTRNDQRVVISTYTITLQDQLIMKDIPALAGALEIPFRAAVLKGRGNYLCPRRLATIRRRRPTSLDEVRTLAKILVWLLESNTGDKGELTLRGSVEHSTWQRLSAEDENCTLDRCREMMQGACPFYKARRAAEAAHLVVVNHALLVSDALAENRVLPDYRYLVIDEAHQFEDAITTGISVRLDRSTLHRRLVDLGSASTGLLGDLLNTVHNRIPEPETGKLRAFVTHIGIAGSEMKELIDRFFGSVRTFGIDARDGRSDEGAVQVLITQRERARPGFAQVQAAWTPLSEYFEVLAEKMRHLTDFLGAKRKQAIPGLADLVTSAAAVARYFSEVRRQLGSFVVAPETNTIYWLHIGLTADSLTINSGPLHVGPLVEQIIWQQKESVILTSATLRTQDSFDYIRSRLYADDVETLEVGSPFDYRQSTLIFIPDDIPEPSHRQAYQHAVERGLIELAAALNGRVLGLFTSYAQLRQTAQAIAPRLALGNIAVYDQSDGTSRQVLLDSFKTAEKAVLLGTRSFWEGIDIPGASLSALVIVRLPFAVPTEPIFAARSETYTDPFNEYAIPEAVLRFRQGFGRLIRSRTDRGIVAIFDSRVLNKGYGAAFLEALPECTVQYGPLELLPEAARNWLNRPSLPTESS